MPSHKTKQQSAGEKQSQQEAAGLRDQDLEQVAGGCIEPLPLPEDKNAPFKKFPGVPISDPVDPHEGR